MKYLELICSQLTERLAPLQRLQIGSDHIPQAAVTLILREAQEEDAQILIIKRAERPGDHWSGNLALPGGRAEVRDVDLIATAARETHEEIGINLCDGGNFIGQLPVIAPRNPVLPPIEITPFVVLAPPQFTIQMGHEVAAVFWLSVSLLKHQGPLDEFRMKVGAVVNKWPAYRSEGGPIWGITERILTNFLELIDR